jgi:hypothetical protein
VPQVLILAGFESALCNYEMLPGEAIHCEGVKRKQCAGRLDSLQWSRHAAEHDNHGSAYESERHTIAGTFPVHWLSRKRNALARVLFSNKVFHRKASLHRGQRSACCCSWSRLLKRALALRHPPSGSHPSQTEVKQRMMVLIARQKNSIYRPPGKIRCWKYQHDDSHQTAT